MTLDISDGASSRPPPLDHLTRGDTNLFGFIVTLNYPRTGLSAPSTGLPEDEIDLTIRDFHSTITHEGVHFLHAVMTSFMYRLAVRLWKQVQLSAKVVREAPETELIRMPLPALAHIREILLELDQESRALAAGEIRGISPRHILEGAAVFLTERMHVPEVGHADFLQRLSERFGASRSHYCDAYRLAAHYLGEDVFEVFSPLCLLALCTEKPGRTFCRLIEALSKSNMLHNNNHPSAQKLGEIATSFKITGIRTAPQEIERVGEHPILTPYLYEILNQPQSMPFLEFAARPYEVNYKALTRFFVPPLCRFSDGSAIINPSLPDLLRIPGELSDDDRRRKNVQSLVFTTTISGAALRMATSAEYEPHMQCPHEACPYFEMRLCHAYPPIPKDYQSCTFPEWFRDAFHKELSSFA